MWHYALTPAIIVWLNDQQIFPLSDTNVLIWYGHSHTEQSSTPSLLRHLLRARPVFTWSSTDNYVSVRSFPRMGLLLKLYSGILREIAIYAGTLETKNRQLTGTLLTRFFFFSFFFALFWKLSNRDSWLIYHTLSHTPPQTISPRIYAIWKNDPWQPLQYGIPYQYGNLSPIRKIQSKLKKLFWWQSQTEAFFHQSRGYNSKTNYPIWLGFELVRVFIHVHLICKFQEDPIKTEQVMMMTKSNRGFFSNQKNVILKINDPICQGFKNIRDFIHVTLNPKCQRLFQQSRGQNS